MPFHNFAALYIKPLKCYAPPYCNFPPYLALRQILEEVILHQRLLDHSPGAEVLAVLCHLF